MRVGRHRPIMNRRWLLRTGLATAAVTVAGCIDTEESTDPASGADGDEDEPDNDTDDEPSTATDGDEPTETNHEESTEMPEQQVTNRIEVVSMVGLVADGAISAVELVVAPAPGADPIDLGAVTIQWVDETGTYDLAAADSTASTDGTFRITAIKDGDGSAPVMNAADDRMKLSMALGATDAVSGVEGFSAPMEPGESATLQLTTQSGATTSIRLAVPETLADQRAVAL